MFPLVVIFALLCFPALGTCKKTKVPKFQNPWTYMFQQDGMTNHLKKVPTHPSHPQLQTLEGSTPGWVYTYQYNGTVCDTSKASYEYGMVTNQCFTSIADKDSNLSPSLMIVCEGDVAYNHLYNSSDCNPATEIGTEYKYLNTCVFSNSSDLVRGFDFYHLDVQQSFCVPGSTLPVSDGDWVLLSAYAEEDCNEMYYFNAMHNNVCYQTEFEALIYNYPNASFFEVPYYSAPYYSVNCTDYNIGASVELPTTCDNVWFYADDDFIYSANAKGESTIYSMYSSAESAMPTTSPTTDPTLQPSAVPTTDPTVQPTAVPTTDPTTQPTAVPTTDPTVQPTAVPTTDPTVQPSAVPTTDPTTQPTAVPTTDPTVQPTAVPTRVPTAQGTLAPTLVPTSSPTFPAYLIFTSNITLSGVSSTSLDQASQQAVVNTTAISMNIPNNQVSFVSAYSVPSSSPVSVSVSAAAVRGHTRGGKVHFTASSSIVAITKVKAPLSDPSQSTALYTQLTSALNQSVSSNEFSETLQSLSKATGATQTMNANATGVWSSAATVSSVATSSSSSSNDDGLSGGAIAGIVIGVVAFMALMLGGGYYLYAKKNSQSSGSSNNVTNEAPAVNIVMTDNPARKNK